MLVYQDLLTGKSLSLSLKFDLIFFGISSSIISNDNFLSAAIVIMKFFPFILAKFNLLRR